VIRLVGLVLGSVVVVVACGVRLRREAELAAGEQRRRPSCKTQRLAEVLQRSLPEDPRPLANLDIGGRYRPA